MKNANFRRAASSRFNLILALGYCALVAPCARGEVIEPEVLVRVPASWTLFNPIIQAPDGNFYGATPSGGAANRGVIYRITSAGALSTVIDFTDSSPGTAPLVAAAGNLYGTAIFGGAHGRGTVYKVTAAGVQTHLFHFDGTNGATPLGLVMDNLGNLYGTTLASPGSIFKLAPDGTFTTIHRFAADTFPAMLILGRDGQLYGRTYHNQTGRGIVYRFSVNDGTFTTLAQLSGSTAPLATFLTDGNNGYLYGTTPLSGTSNAGTIFRVSTQGGGATTLLQFDGSNGAQPSGPLAIDHEGNLYGTTWFGGVGFGAAFKMNPAGALTTLASFTSATGVNPFTGVTLAVDGNLYGTTGRTIFRVRLRDSDTDADGVPDDADECADTLAGAIVNQHGCSLDQLVPCLGYANHGQYLSALALHLAGFLSQGLLTPDHAHALFTAAAQSDCGKNSARHSRK